MAQESLAPDAYIEQTNLDGTIYDIDEDPDSPDGNWADAIADDANTVAHVSFPTPAGNPTVGAGLQEFKVYVRRSATGGTNPDLILYLYENSGLLATGATNEVSSDTGEIFSFTWDASLLSNANGSAVECYIFGKRSGGSPANRRTVEVGACEWNCDYVTAPAIVTKYLNGNDCPVFPHGMDMDSDKLPCPAPY